MDWIQKHYDQFALALMALLLLAASVLLLLSARGFQERFSGAMVAVTPGQTLPPLELDRVDAAKAALQTPPKWANDNPTRGSLFVSQRYIIGKDGNPEKPGEGFIHSDSLTEKQIPNRWFLDNNLPLLDPTVPRQDPDGDGFSNEDEWRLATDPNSKDSHPGYQTKLFLSQFIKVPFRLLFNAYDGDVKKDKPEQFSYQINTIDLRQPSEFLKTGEKVSNTKFRLDKFEYKTRSNASTGEQEDVSELTVVNVETNEQVTLVLGKVTDSPNTFALLEYQWPQPALEFRVEKLREFSLKPNPTERFKLLDIKEAEALIQLPTGEKYSVPRDPRKK